MRQIKYKKKGSGYILDKTYSVQTSIFPGRNLFYEEIQLTRCGILRISRRYWWNGPSGPTVDTPDFMRGSLIHDPLCELIEQGLLDPKWRKKADRELLKACLEDGMPKFRARYVYRAVRLFGESHTLKPSKIYTAP